MMRPTGGVPEGVCDGLPPAGRAPTSDWSIPVSGGAEVELVRAGDPFQEVVEVVWAPLRPQEGISSVDSGVEEAADPLHPGRGGTL
jgi:hypothetical protein